MSQTLKASSTRDNAQMIERARKRLSKRAKRGFRGYPLATVALYGPDVRAATKFAVGIVPAEHADATELRRWFSEGADIRNVADIAEEAGVRRGGWCQVRRNDRHNHRLPARRRHRLPRANLSRVHILGGTRSLDRRALTLVPSSKALAQFQSGALLAQPALSPIPAASTESGWLPRLIAGD
jgi:hypothetical protein